jgi:hypothetical protein
MGKLRHLAFSYLLVALSPWATADPASIDAATAVAEQWLAGVDRHEYGMSWSEASPLLRAEVNEADWVENLDNLRGHLGKLEARTLQSSEYHDSLPDMPSGEYVILVYDSAFENYAALSEAVGLAKHGDTWRVIGYYFP